jgi:hypothetical protein
MQHISKYKSYLSGLGIAAIALLGNLAPVLAATSADPMTVTPSESNTLLAQATDRCRRVVVPEGLNIRAQPSLTAAIIGGVGNQQTINLSTTPATVNAVAGLNWVQITLSNGATGWIANGAPGSGGNVILCSPVAANPTPTPTPTTAPPTSTGGTCRLVRSPIGGGLAIRSTPSGTSIAGVANGQTVTLVNPPVTRLDGGRQWLQISAPSAGWVSNGQPGSSGNLGNCP